MRTTSFNPILVTKKLLSSLDERPRRILEERFGLISAQPRTLESIGQEYGITRERVRQIEAAALNKMQKAETFSQLSGVFDELKDNVEKRGVLVQEKDFLSFLANKENQRNHLLFLLVAGEDFKRLKEDEALYPSWTTNQNQAVKIKTALQALHNEIDENTLISEKDILAIFKKHLRNVFGEKVREEIISPLLKISRLVGCNALGEWGIVHSPYIKPRGMRDYGFLVMRRHGSPMHFSEVARSIKENFGRPAHGQTVHNELIKDDRFVLVGRGLYALKEWGYANGTVRDVILKILKAYNTLSKEDIMKKVLKERYVKENTILVNLQNTQYFKKDREGNYTLC